MATVAGTTTVTVKDAASVVIGSMRLNGVTGVGGSTVNSSDFFLAP